MGLFDIFKKKTTDVTFEKVKYNKNRTVENNSDGLIDDPTWQQIEAYLDKMYGNDDEFVTLTLSEAVNGVRYIQACKVDNEYSIQLGLEKGNATKLVEAFFKREELQKVFADFYDYAYVANIDSYKPVSFMM